MVKWSILKAEVEKMPEDKKNIEKTDEILKLLKRFLSLIKKFNQEEA